MRAAPVPRSPSLRVLRADEPEAQTSLAGTNPEQPRLRYGSISKIKNLERAQNAAGSWMSRRSDSIVYRSGIFR